MLFKWPRWLDVKHWGQWRRVEWEEHAWWQQFHGEDRGVGGW